MSTQTPPVNRPQEVKSFAETALTLGGKSADEARRTGAIDTADDQVEALFAPEYQTVNSPAHRAVWDRGVPVELFMSAPPKTPPDVQRVMDDSVAVVAASQGGGHAAQRRTQDRGTRADRFGRRRLLGPVGRQGIWRQRRAVQFVRSVPHADGTRRSDGRRFGFGAWLHRRGRSGAHIWQHGAEAAVSARPGQRLAAERVRTHRAVRRQRSHRAPHNRAAGGRPLRRQRREAVHHERRARPDDRVGLPDRRQTRRAHRGLAATGKRTFPASEVRPLGAEAHVQSRHHLSRSARACRELASRAARRRPDDRLPRPQPRSRGIVRRLPPARCD